MIAPAAQPPLGLPALAVPSTTPLHSAAAVMEESLLLEQFPPYSRVLLCELLKNRELNGRYGIVVPQSVSVWPEVPGCLKVRLASGQEVAVRPANMRMAVDSTPAQVS